MRGKRSAATSPVLHMARFRDSKLYDLMTVTPLIVWYGAAIVGLAPEIAHGLAGFRTGGDLRLGLEGLSKALTLAFLGLQILLFILRRVPMRRSPGWRPRVAALVGSNLQLAFLALPRVTMGLDMALASTVLIVIGMAGAIATALWLGRGFAIFPQARSLVTAGPYRLVRHPLYVCEQIAGFGAMLQFAMPWALLVTLASFAAQFPRMHYEERILAATYPAYRDYAARTRRLAPGLY